MSGNEQQVKTDSKEYTEEERIAIKYKFIREKIFYHFNRGSKILKISKIVVSIAFVLFTFVAVAASHRSNNILQWLTIWIIVIFVNVAIFIIAEYIKYLIESKVIPYLEDDEQIEFGEYDIFIEDIDGESEEDENEEDEEE